MAYEYHPKDPRAKLRDVVTRYLANMRVAGRRPNRGVAFGSRSAGDDAPRTEGWLLADRRSGPADGDHYLLLEDGDVWVGDDADGADPRHPGASPELDAAVARWLAEPSDDLVTLLARSLADARMGGTGWLADGEAGVRRVADRRVSRSAHDGPERRSA